MTDKTHDNLPLNQLRQIRIDKLKKLQDMGINPFPSRVERTHFLIDITESFDELENSEVLVIGRITSWREHGKLVFADINDYSGKLQICVKESEISPHEADNQYLGFNDLPLLDLGDFIQIKGIVTKTKRGEISVLVKELILLTKSIRPMPSSHFGLKDEEERYRQRYVDFNLNPELRELFVRKSKFWNSMREFLSSKDFLEVETPVLENTAGGADADPFITHHKALDIDVYLRISMGELWQKRLMVGGFEKTFELGRQFRNEGISREHLQDYTQMEFYWAYANYEDSMQLVEEMYKHVIKQTFSTLEFTIGNHEVNFGGEWKKIDYRETLLSEIGIDILTADEDELKNKAIELKLEFDPNDSRGRLIDTLWKSIRKKISGPVFLVGHPVEVSPLAKRNPEKPELVERYQVIIAGSEQGNGYSELNDPIDQAERFQKQQEMREAGDDEAQMHDEDFVRALEYGMPPVSGFGVSERLFSFLENKSIRECVMFPLLRPEGLLSSDRSVEISGVFNTSIQSELKQDFPGISFAYISIDGVDINKSHPELESLKTDVTEAQSKTALDEISSLKSISAYREIFKATKVDIHSCRPSPEALLRRVVQGKGIYNVNTAVDAYNLAVLESKIGLGGFDADKIDGPIILRYSKAGEKAHLLGDNKETILRDGQIIYADQSGPITVDLNYRDIDKTKITNKTKNIILFADGAPGLDQSEIESALRKGAEYIQRFCGGTLSGIEYVN